MSIRGALAVLLFSSFPGFAQAPAEPGQLDASPALFSVMAAINAAGYDSGADSPLNSPVRELVRREVASRNLPVVEELKAYYKAHRQPDGSSDISQYVSFALCVENPPEFKYRYKPQELPPDVVPLEGFRTLLTRFHREANVDALWQKAQPAIEEMIRRYQRPSIDALISVNAYLRNTAGAALNSRFQIYVDVLGAPNQVQTRSYRNDYFVVVTPSAEPQANDVRHGYLHYLLDPLALRFSEELNRKKSLADYAQAAPALTQFYKDDYLLLATESLIKAIESRLAPAGARQEHIDRAMSEGFVLTAAFADGLVKYEKQEQALRFYFAELVSNIDLKRESARLDKIQFAPARAPRNRVESEEQRRAEPVGVFKTLAEADQALERKDYEGAKSLYLRVLRETSERPVQAKAYYALGKIATLQNDPDLAVRLFEKTLETSPDDYVKGYTLLYLGRLADASGEREKARERYQAVLEVQGAAVTARKAAEKGLQQAFQK